MLIHSFRRILSFPAAVIVSLIVYGSLGESGILYLIALPALFFVFIGALVCPHTTRKVVIIFSLLGLVFSGGTSLVIDCMVAGSFWGLAAPVAQVIGVALGAGTAVLLQNYRLKQVKPAV